VAGETIVVVDDNPSNVKLVRFVLTRQGYDVRVAGDAREALSLLETITPHLILMDLQLPGMDGWELTRVIKACPRLERVPIVAVTAFAMKGDEQTARNAGCDGYITKPINTQAFPNVIRSYIVGPLGAKEER
jgi:CheY-like chemotaxis protein